jgi:hypothetical protein
VDEEIIVSCVELSRERQVVKWIDASLTECRVDVSLCPTLRIRASVCLVCGQYMIRGCNGMIALPSSPQCQIWMTDRLIFESSTNSKDVDLREWWLTSNLHRISINSQQRLPRLCYRWRFHCQWLQLWYWCREPSALCMMRMCFWAGRRGCTRI